MNIKRKFMFMSYYLRLISTVSSIPCTDCILHSKIQSLLMNTKRKFITHQHKFSSMSSYTGLIFNVLSIPCTDVYSIVKFDLYSRIRKRIYTYCHTNVLISHCRTNVIILHTDAHLYLFDIVG